MRPDPESRAPSPPSPLPEVGWEVVVVGAGPAGSLVARELARLGSRVLLLDRDTFPRWKVCGACFSPGAQRILGGVGLGHLPRKLGAVPLGTLVLRGWGRSARVPLEGTLGLSRRALDLALQEAAAEAGSEVLTGAHVRWAGRSAEAAHLEVRHPSGGFRVSARLVVAADGLRSGLMAQAGLPGAGPGNRGGGKVGVGAVFPGSTSAYEPGRIHMVVGSKGYVGLAPTEDGALNVAAALTLQTLREAGSPGEVVRGILEEARAPPLEGEPVEGWRGTPGLGSRPPRLGGERILAVGDAAGFPEPFTGEGMSWALAGAVTLAPLALEAVGDWDPRIPRRWEALFRGSVYRAQRLSRGVAWTLRRPLLSRRLIRLLHHFPAVAVPLVRRAATPPRTP